MTGVRWPSPDEVAAIYMDKKSARFIQGRLIMHGAERATPVTVIENASRPDQRVLATTLDLLSEDLTAARLNGPASPLSALLRVRAELALPDLSETQELA